MSSVSAPMSSSSSSFLSSVTAGDGSVSNGGQQKQQVGPLALRLVPAGWKPPLSVAPPKRKCGAHAHSEDVAGKYGVNGGRCHCSKRRYIYILLVLKKQKKKKEKRRRNLSAWRTFLS